MKIFSSEKTPEGLPILVTAGQKKCLHHVYPHSSGGPSHLQILHLVAEDWTQSALLALGFIQVHWDALVAFAKGYNRELEVDKARAKAFNSNISLSPLTGDLTIEGTSAGAGLAMTLLYHVFGIKFSQEVVMTGEITASGRVLAIGDVVAKAGLAEKGGKKTFLLPEASAEDLKAWQGRNKRSGDQPGDGVTATGCSTLWEVLVHAVAPPQSKSFR